MLKLNYVEILHHKIRIHKSSKWPCLENSDPEEFLLFIKNFKTTFKPSVALSADSKLQYLRNLLHGETIRQFDTLYAQVDSTTETHLRQIVLGLGVYFPLLMSDQTKIA